jgi:hypothetical protein
MKQCVSQCSLGRVPHDCRYTTRIRQGSVYISREGGTQCGKAAPGNQPGRRHPVSRRHPVAETSLLDWDGTSTTLSFSFCIYHDWCKTAPGDLTLQWSVDATEWQILWNKSFVDLPSKRSSSLRAAPVTLCPLQAVSVAVPVNVTAPRFAVKWVHRDLGERDSSSSDPCSVTLLDDITLPAQAPTAANMAFVRAAIAPDATAESCSACTTLCNTGSLSSTGGRRRHLY